MIHCTRELETIVGDDCVIGHLAHLEGCIVEDGALVGTGSIVLHRAIVRTGALVGAARARAERYGGAGGAMALGVPAKLRLERGAARPDHVSRVGVRAELGALPRGAPPHRLSARRSRGQTMLPTDVPDAVADRRSRPTTARRVRARRASTWRTAERARRSRRAPPSATSSHDRDGAIRIDVGEQRSRASGRIAPAVNASADVHAAWTRLRRRDLGDPELVARVRADLVVRHAAAPRRGGRARVRHRGPRRSARARAARHADALERLRFDARDRPARRRAASSPRCTRRRPSTSRRRRAPASPR